MKKTVLLLSLLYTNAQLHSMDTNYNYLNSCLIKLQCAKMDAKVFACCDLQTKDLLRQTCTTFAQYIPTNYGIYNHSPLIISYKQTKLAIDFAVRKPVFKILDNLLINSEQNKLYALQNAIHARADQGFKYVIKNHPPDDINTILLNGLTLLHETIFADNIFAAQCLLSNSDCSVNQQSRDKNYPLYYACKNGNAKIVHLLLKNNATTDIGQYTLLHIAASNDYWKTMHIVLNHSTEQIDQQDQCGKTPLHIAIERCHVKTAKLLCLHNANKNILSSYYYTPLYLAAAYKIFEIVEILLRYPEAVKLINKVMDNNTTVLDMAHRTKSTKIIQLLRSYGAKTKEELDNEKVI